MKVGIFGTGAYGLALTSILVNNNIDTTIWTKFETEKEMLEKIRKNEKLLPGYTLDNNVKITTNIQDLVNDKDLLIIAIPATFVENLCIEISKYINQNQHILIASKGIEQKQGLFIHEIVKTNIKTNNIAVISGPSFAKDVITKKPIGLSLATEQEETEKIVKKCFCNDYIKLRTTTDIIGVEICGSIKNVIAISSGMLDGLKANDSTRAMLITEALHDMEEIIEVLGGKKDTILSFAGFGDLLLTCTSSNSRNFTFGQNLGKGMSKEEIKNYLNTTTVEGNYTLESIYRLLKNKKVNIPIIDLIYNIVKKGENPNKLLTFLIEKN